MLIIFISLCFLICKQVPISLRHQTLQSENITTHPVSRVYAYVNVDKPIFKTQPKHFQFKDGNISNYIAEDLVGKGAFSRAYIGHRISDNEKVILKILKEDAKTNINKEIMILKQLQGQSEYIVQLLDASRLKPNSIIVYNYLSTMTFNKIAFTLNPQEFKAYMRQILMGLNCSHANGIMHRDIKLGNIIVNPHQKQLQIIDWGLGEFYFPNKKSSTKAGTRYYKPPEQLLGYPYYDYGVDMWSFGCLFAGIMFHKHPFFRGKDLNNQLVKISKVLGTKDLENYLGKYAIKLKEDLKEQIKSHRKKEWRTFLNEKNGHLCDEQGLDLLSKILVYDHSARLSAGEALEHPFFRNGII